MEANFYKTKLKFASSIFNGNSLNDVQKEAFSSAQEGLKYVSSKDIDVNSNQISLSTGLAVPAGDLSQYKIAPSGSPLLCIEGGSAGRKIGFTDTEVCFVNKLACFSPKKGVSGRFIFYSLLSKPFRHQFNQAMTGMIGGVSISSINNFEISLPSYELQCTVAAYLDNEIGRIDTLISEKQTFITLLKEKRQALISHFVTKKPVNSRLSFYCDILPGYAFPSSEFSDNPNDVPLLRGINLGVGELKWNEVVYWNASELYGVQKFLLEPGDIVFGLDRPWITNGARVAVIKAEDIPCLLLQRVARLKAKGGLKQEYLRLLLESDVFYAYFEPELTGISVPHISTGQIGEFKFYLPSAEEQKAVVESYDRESRKIRALIDETENSIELLREHRTALISAAVTGKIDVRGMVDTKGGMA